MKAATATVTVGAVLAGMAWAAPVRAQAMDFTITVPVNVSGVPAVITEMGITCYIMPRNTGDMHNEIAFGGRRVTIVGGAYHGNVVITMNALPGVDPSPAKFYSCNAQFYGSDRATYFADGQTLPPVFPLVAGAPFYLGSNSSWTPIPGR
jgi:hypothetical protein